ncbi:hypothetical protein R5H30_15440 [Sulfitobacter sp. D35]|uniref:hypothetical protein n=1 Tax=Sulfitobacter sp. D35 TaxID=3083252 RepID=UPI00296E95A9|nr:hypothetical protein [Sulfitobacter sp. D35]MDW4499387.1 hypothetical protein [Sulfitobacter sp. D35]
MTPDEVRTFIEGHTLDALDPETGAVVASVHYGRDGRCRLEFADGRCEAGLYGFEGDTYWTRYETFRNGAHHAFRLEALAPGVAQAHFSDGRRAFLQVRRDISGQS